MNWPFCNICGGMIGVSERKTRFGLLLLEELVKATTNWILKLLLFSGDAWKVSFTYSKKFCQLLLYTILLPPVQTVNLCWKACQGKSVLRQHCQKVILLFCAGCPHPLSTKFFCKDHWPTCLETKSDSTVGFAPLLENVMLTFYFLCGVQVNFL